MLLKTNFVTIITKIILGAVAFKVQRTDKKQMLQTCVEKHVRQLRLTDKLLLSLFNFIESDGNGVYTDW